jgi:hypothetical protein
MHHIVKTAALNVLTLEPAGQNVGADQALTEREKSIREYKVVIPPSATMQTLRIPAHRRFERLDKTEQRE